MKTTNNPKILFNGCSWTYGDDLQVPTLSRYSKLTADYFNTSDDNIAVNASSNGAIIRRSTWSLGLREYDIALVQLTFFTRLECPMYDQLENLNPTNSTIFAGNNIAQFIAKTNKKYDTYVRYWYDKIFLFDNYCKSKNIKPIFFFIDNPSLETMKKVTIEEHDIDFVMTNSLKGICDDSGAEYGHEQGNHPLEEGHKLIAEKLIIPEIEKRL